MTRQEFVEFRSFHLLSFLLLLLLLLLLLMLLFLWILSSPPFSFNMARHKIKQSLLWYQDKQAANLVCRRAYILVCSKRVHEQSRATLQWPWYKIKFKWWYQFTVASEKKIISSTKVLIRKYICLPTYRSSADPCTLNPVFTFMHSVSAFFFA